MSLSQDGGNELWREIKKNDPAVLYRYATNWSAVKRIASLKPELLNTVSNSGWTTLMQAAYFHCSNEVIIFMMKQANPQTLVTTSDHGFSLQHALARSCLMPATRHLLNQTNKLHINLRTKNLSSPLHMCMYENDIKFEDRVGTIKVLLDNGADITAMDKDGLTPIEKCEKNISKYSWYSEDKKQELLHVLRGEKIPAEILARGPDALKQYQKALEEGQSDYNFVRVMVMGQENVGKTCLIDSLLGKNFNEKHIITDAIAVTRSCVCDEADDTNWKQVDVCKTEMKDKHENALATSIAKTLLRKKEVVSSPEYTVESQTNGIESQKTLEPSDDQKREQSQVYGIESPKTLKPSGDLKRKICKDVDGDRVSAGVSGENKRSKTQTNGATSQATTSASSIEANGQPQTMKQYSQDIKRKVVQVMEGASIIDNSFRIWDYGGQPIYHTIHRFYMTPEGIFVIVFNIADDLDACSIVVDSFGVSTFSILLNCEYKNHNFFLRFIL
ncbi:uncharacterized protein LOC117109439 isoform X3 [Anneissia japonica]|uniref:uncharacterized protein LOC117109439 isoform X3 n=1 Tax=Anneissia japonica TaxID=1529436 RepID=UPI001425A0EC|nr:uncharacterized protein LOC117109439 isoform X3 [Anneissia japonica]